MIHLVLGGARSGKSRYALDCVQRATAKDQVISFIATAEARDAEMSARIERHQQERPDHWFTLEAPLQLTQALEQAGPVVIVDCLTLWLSNWLCSDDPQGFKQAKTELLEYLPQTQQQVWLVSNEVGSGIVPLGELNRQFVDEAGWLNQSIAQVADKVTLVAAGLPLPLKE